MEIARQVTSRAKPKEGVKDVSGGAHEVAALAASLNG